MPKYRLLTPGPVAVPERVRLAMAHALLHHRAPEFLPVLAEVRDGLRRVFQTERDVLLLTCSGTGAMEAAVANLFSPGDRVVVVRGGKFGERWAEICAAFGVEAECVDVEWGRAVEPAEVRAALGRVPNARGLLVTASETSTGVWHPVRELAALLREQRPDCLIVVDGISAVGVHDMPMDAWGLDAVVSGSQKSWLLPPGLAFVALSDRARDAVHASTSPRYYFDLRKEMAIQPELQTAYTVAVSLVAGLREALNMIFEEGLLAVFGRHAALAHATRAAAQALGLELYSPDSPSHACTAVRVPDGVDGAALVRQLRDRYNVVLAGGQDRATGRIFRIGHMGDVDASDTIAAIAALEMALLDLGYPVKLGEGTRTATELLRELPARRG